MAPYYQPSDSLADWAKLMTGINTLKIMSVPTCLFIFLTNWKNFKYVTVSE